jgi:putative NADH-flavin reductase
MKILVIGASGLLGQEIIKRNGHYGYTLTAMVRDAKSYQRVGNEDRVVSGDVLQPASLREAMSGQDAVICSLGTGATFRHVTVFSEGTRNLLDVAEKESTSPRLVIVTGIGAGESRGHGGFLYDKIIKPTILHSIYEDKDRQEAMLMESNAHWIGIRPGILTNGEAKGDYRVLSDLTGITVGKIARADVADFLLRQLTSDTYLHQFPTICY